MPIYKYKCNGCKVEYEQLYIPGRVEEAADACPQCGSKDREKLIGATSFQLKGSGWAKDHYGAKKRKN